MDVAVTRAMYIRGYACGECITQNMKWVSFVPNSAMPKSKICLRAAMGTTEMLSPSPPKMNSLRCCCAVMPDCLKADMPAVTPVLPLSFPLKPNCPSSHV